MNIYELRQILEEHRKFKKIDNYYYEAIFFKGNFELYDYNAGILRVKIHLAVPNNDLLQGGISISTVDDGTWWAEANKPVTEELAQKAINIFNQYIYLPSEKELNKELITIGFYGQFTG